MKNINKKLNTKSTTLIASLALSGLCSNTSMAEESFFQSLFQTNEYGSFEPNSDYYFGVGVGQSLYIEDSFEELSLSAFAGRLGYIINDNYNVELRYATALTDEDFNVTSRELDTLMGIYFVPVYNLNRKINLYGLVGYSDLEFTYVTDGVNETIETSGPSIGGGIEIVMSKRAKWTIEFTVYNDEKDKSYGAFTGGFKISF